MDTMFVREYSYKVKNTGTNPLVLWKKIAVTNEATGDKSEPECTEQGGSWNNVDKTCTGGSDDNNISKAIHYAMTLGDGPGKKFVINPQWDVMVKDVDGVWVSLGWILAGEEKTVTQYYYLDADTGNWAQGDEMTFDITLYAEQYLAPGPAYAVNDPANQGNGLVLENKDLADEWKPLVVDGTWGLLTWDAGGNYKFRGWGLDASKSYRVVYYSGSENNFAVSGTPAADGTLTLIGTYAGLNANTDAKYWLRVAVADPWNYNAQTLWEANLVN